MVSLDDFKELANLKLNQEECKFAGAIASKSQSNTTIYIEIRFQ